MLLNSDLKATELANDLSIRSDLISRRQRKYADSGSGKIEKKLDPKNSGWNKPEIHPFPKKNSGFRPKS